jgi:signal transduction histidine kinase/DNA-binding response OmpR family regulator
MGKPLRVLIIEDSEDDALLLLRELKRDGYEVEFERVETAVAMLSALAQKTWDVILSDYSLPEFNAPQALQVMKASGLDLPFIISSGTIGEDTAVAALKAGAHDFFVKGKFAMLGPAIERELREAETRRERKKAEEALRKSERVLREAESLGHTSSWEHDLVTGEIFNTPGNLHLFFGDNLSKGVPFDDYSQAVHPDDREFVMQRHAQLLEGGPPDIEYRVVWPDGSVHVIFGLATVVRDGLGKPIRIYGTNVEVTERKRAEGKIDRQLRHLNSLRAIDTAISSSFDIQVVLDIVLQQVLSQLGVDASAILLFNPRLPTIHRSASRGFRSNAIDHVELKLGEGYAGRAIRERRTIHIPGLMETDGKLAKALKSAKEEFVDYYGVPLIVKGEVKGVLEIYHRSLLNPDQEWLDFLEILAGQAAIAIDSAQLFEDLQRSNAELEQRVARRTAELYQTNLELERANRAKDEFLATMSHELRTPLNSILGLSETLLEQMRDPLTAYQQKSLKIIAASGEHLLESINDILDLSKIEAGKFDYFPQVVGVDDLCRSSLTFVKEQATRKSITLTYQQEMSVSKIYADPRRLKQILVNLLMNAVKFTPNHGEVILQMQGNMEQDRIQFSVTDTGIGIAPEDMKKLFQPFVQIDSRLTREYEGTGLGLALVQKLTDLHGGSVDVESETGKGSRFIINLPIGKVMLDQEVVSGSDSKPTVSEPAGRSNISFAEPAGHGIILLAEDNLANIMTIGDYLESRGYQVVVAHDGLEALTKAQELQPQLILMDIQMPVLNGLEAISRLRADPRFGSTPIIALTALAMPGDRERCLVVGANEYMSKPVSLKKLSQTIDELLSQKTSTWV